VSGREIRIRCAVEQKISGRAAKLCCRGQASVLLFGVLFVECSTIYSSSKGAGLTGTVRELPQVHAGNLRSRKGCRSLAVFEKPETYHARADGTGGADPR